MPRGMSRAGSVNRATADKMRARYRDTWGRSWPHDDDYLKLLWLRAQNKNEKGNSRIPHAEVIATCLLAMRENHEFDADIPDRADIDQFLDRLDFDEIDQFLDSHI